MSLENQKHLSLINKQLNETSEEILNIPSAYPNIINLNLSNNKLTEYPQCLLQCKTLIILDIRKNIFKDFNKLISSISQYPYIAELCIDFSDPTQVQSLLDSIPQLILINGQSTKEFISLVDIDDGEMDAISLKAALPNLHSIFTDIQSGLQKGKADDDDNGKANELFTQFQALINEEASKENSIDDTLPNYSIANFALESQNNILQFFSNKILEYSSMIASSDRDHITKEIFDGVFKVINALSSIISKLPAKIEASEVTMRNQIEIALRSMKPSKSDGSKTEEEGGGGALKKMMQAFNNDKDFYLTKIERLESENKYMIDKLLFLSRQITADSYNHTIDSKGKKAALTTSQSQLRDQSQIGFTTNTLSFINNSISSFSSLPQSNANASTIGVTGARILSLNSMKEIINEIYESKIEYDKRCKENNLPRETMEQHMYSHLNTKYGLRNLVIEWASSIINCIKLYSKEDCDVCLFGKITRNEIEEDARLVMGKVKSTINDLIEYSIKVKAPFISKVDLQKGLQNKMEGMLTLEEWRNILHSVHSKEDAGLIEKELHQISINENDKKCSQGNNSNKAQDKKITREQETALNKQPDINSISYKAFIQCVCNYHIQYRVKYLQPFVKLYRKFDEDSDGILNEDEFKALIQMIYPNKTKIDHHIEKLLNVIDPFNNKRVTFTECVSLFSIEFIVRDKQDNKSTSLLDYVCLNSNLL